MLWDAAVLNPWRAGMKHSPPGPTARLALLQYERCGGI